MTDDLVGIVAGQRMSVLATVRKDGRAQLSTVMYAWDSDERIYGLPPGALPVPD